MTIAALGWISAASVSTATAMKLIVLTCMNVSCFSGLFGRQHF
jgi:hypothetical protein